MAGGVFATAIRTNRLLTARTAQNDQRDALLPLAAYACAGGRLANCSDLKQVCARNHSQFDEYHFSFYHNIFDFIIPCSFFKYICDQEAPFMLSLRR